MGVGAGLYMYDVVLKSLRSLSHLLMNFLYLWISMFQLSNRVKPKHFNRSSTHHTQNFQCQIHICSIYT